MLLTSHSELVELNKWLSAPASGYENQNATIELEPKIVNLSPPHKGVKASANSDVMYFFTSAQVVQPLLPWVDLVSHLGDHYHLVVSDLGQLRHQF
ncbi:hypothetical protein Tco_0377284 [Tanacetum coccineum]